MIWNIIENCATVAEYSIYSDFMIRFLKTKSPKYQWIAFLVILLCNCVLTFAFNYFMPFEGLLGIIRISMNLLLAFLLLKGSTFEKIFASFITDAMVIAINFTTSNCFCLLIGKTVENLITERGMLRLTTLFITKFVFFMLTRIILKSKQKENYHFAPFELMSCSALLIITVFVELEVFNLSIKDELSTQSPSAIGAAVGLIGINVLVYLLIRKISHVNHEKTLLILDNMQLELYKSQLADTEKQYRETKQIRHDMRNHLQCIDLLLQDGEITKAHDYITDMINHKLNFGYAGVKTGYRVVDVIANTKLYQCSLENIGTTLNISKFELQMDDVDICIILGNLFDNAIEACRKVKGERSIYFEIVQQKGYAKMIIRNTVNEDVLLENPSLETTKAEKKLHGLGLKSVEKTVNKYGGMVEFYERFHEFTADVWIPSKKIM